jgi:hypothetical protein
MVTTLVYILLALSAATLLVVLYLAAKVKTAVYLLEQPVVKKMSPQLRLKPVKLDEVLNRGGREGRPEGGRPEGGRDSRGPRPERTEGGRDSRGPRPERAEGDRGPRPERREGDRGPRGDRREGGRDGRRDDRGPRPERAEGDRPRREDRPERAEGDRPRREGGERREGGREGRPEGDRAPRREFTETRDFAPAPQADFQAPASESAPLSPRRPLFTDSAEPRTESAPVRENPVAESFVGSNSDDLQHGRRTQLKKKPRFEFDEEETKTEG